MPARRKSRNLFGWLTKKKVTYSRSRGSVSPAVAAYRAGVASGDTGEFEAWLAKRGFDPDRSLRRRLEEQYRRGVERTGKAERVKSERERRKADAKQTASQKSKEREAKQDERWRIKKHRDRDRISDAENRDRRKREAAELKDAELAERRERLERKRAAATDRKIERDWREQGNRNPDCAVTRKSNISDRAKRYRANQPGCRPGGVKKCKICGEKQDLMIDHVDGNESNGRKSNLRWLCRSCNTTLGAEMARTGQGRRTVQYNPAHKGAQTLGEYMQAVLQHTRGAHDAGGKIIHDTPKSRRREFASQIWAARSARAGAGAPDWVTNPQANPFYSVAIFDGAKKLGGRVDVRALTLQSAQEQAQSYADDMGYDAVLYGVDGKSLGRFTTARAIGSPARSGNPRRRNPEPGQLEDVDDAAEYEQAKKTAELFHGRPVKDEIEVVDELKTHNWYVCIGPLVSLKVRLPIEPPKPYKRTTTFAFHLDEQNKVWLWCSPDGRQFYLRGGDQELDLEALGMGPDTEWWRDHMKVGEVTYVTYQDKKKFHQFKLTDYYHKIGSALDRSGFRHVQRTNEKPTLVFDTLSKKLSFVGGWAKVETETLVDGMSPGIVQ